MREPRLRGCERGMYRARQPLAQAYDCFQLGFLRGNREGRSALDHGGVVEGEVVGAPGSAHSGQQLIEVEHVGDHCFGPLAFQSRTAGVFEWTTARTGTSFARS